MILHGLHQLHTEVLSTAVLKDSPYSDPQPVGNKWHRSLRIIAICVEPLNITNITKGKINKKKKKNKTSVKHVKRSHRGALLCGAHLWFIQPSCSLPYCPSDASPLKNAWSIRITMPKHKILKRKSIWKGSNIYFSQKKTTHMEKKIFFKTLNFSMVHPYI